MGRFLAGCESVRIKTGDEDRPGDRTAGRCIIWSMTRSIVKRDETGAAAGDRLCAQHGGPGRAFQRIPGAEICLLYLCGGDRRGIHDSGVHLFPGTSWSRSSRSAQTSEKIGLEQDLSQRIEYDGTFQEIEILAQANNRMLDRLEEMFERQEAVFLGCES